MKRFFTILMITTLSLAHGQINEPILKIETGMHSAYGLKVATDNEGKIIVTCSADNTARLWDALTGKQLRIFRVPIDKSTKGYISACGISTDGNTTVLASYTESNNSFSSYLYILSTQTGEIQHIIKNVQNLVYDIEFSPDGKYMAIGMRGENGVNIYTTVNWNLYKNLSGYSGSVRNLAFDARSRLATISYGATLRQYDNKFLLLSEEKKLSGKKPLSLSFNPAGTVLAIGYEDVITIELREAESLRLLSTPNIENSNSTLSYLSFNNDGTKLAAGHFADHLVDSIADRWVKIIRIWEEGGNGKYTDVKLFPKNVVEDIKPLPNGNWVIMSAYPHLVNVNSDGQIIWEHESGNNDLYAGRNTKHLKVSFAGSIISFTPQYETPLTFDLSDRLLHTETTLFPSMIDSSAGIKITNWNDLGRPIINGDTINMETWRNNRSVDINSKATEIIFGADGGQIFKTDRKGKILWVAKNSVGGVWAVNISGNDKIIVAALSDGTIRWFEMDDGKELLAFYLDNDKKRWVLFTPSGYYDASPGGEDFLGWHVNNGTNKSPYFFPVSRYREQFYRPDVIDAILETYNEKDAVTLANKRREIKADQPETTSVIKNAVPTITIHSPNNGSFVSNNAVSISYTVSSPNNAPPKYVKVLVNGRPVSTERDIKNTSSNLKKIEVIIPQQDCTITLLSENENGTSPEANLFIKWREAENSIKEEIIKPNLYILSIGISNYDKEEYKLTYAAKDAEDFASAVQQQKGRLYNDVVIKTITEKEASKVNILNGLQWIQEKTTKKDIAMIFFAGHGVNDKNGIYYMLPVDADVRYLRSTCINFEEIKQTQSTIEGKVIVFIDACHSGNILGTGGNYINGLINLLSSTVKGAGAITFTSSTGKETSFENLSWGNGAFTKALVEGLNGAASIGVGKEITYTSLALYISQQVKKITADKQHPTFVPAPNTPDFPIALAK